MWGLCKVVVNVHPALVVFLTLSVFSTGFATGHKSPPRLIPHLDVLTELTGDHNKQALGLGRSVFWSH